MSYRERERETDREVRNGKEREIVKSRRHTRTCEKEGKKEEGDLHHMTTGSIVY